MFSLVEFQLSLGGRDFSLSHAVSIKVEELVQGRRDLVFGCLGKGKCMFHHIMQVSVFQLRSDDEDEDCGFQECHPPR